VTQLAHGGHEVLVEAGAGEGSRFSDDEYAAAGAKIVPSADDVFAAADLIAELLATPLRSAGRDRVPGRRGQRAGSAGPSAGEPTPPTMAG
jgi:NAD/NADP transhydrogenase alpha subunit